MLIENSFQTKFTCVHVYFTTLINKIVLARGRGRGQNQRGKGTGSAPWLNQQNQPGGSQTGRGRG